MSSVNEWREVEVEQWLQSNNLDKFTAIFQENNITGDILPLMDHETLKEMGIVSVGDRMRILLAVKKLLHKEGGSGATTKPVKMSKEAIPVTAPPSLGIATQNGLKIQTSWNMQSASQAASKGNSAALKQLGTAYLAPSISSSPSVNQFQASTAGIVVGSPRLGAALEAGMSPATPIRSLASPSPLSKQQQPQAPTTMVMNTTPSSAATFGSELSTPSTERPKRVIKVFGDQNQSRIIDIAEMSTPHEVYAKIFQKFNLIRDRNDTDAVEREMERMRLFLVHPQGSKEGVPGGTRLVQDTELLQLGIANPRDAEHMPRLLLRKKNHPEGLPAVDMSRKMAKLENFFGQPLSATPSLRNRPGFPANGTSSGSTSSPVSSEVMQNFLTHTNKLKNFFGERPPSESITVNLEKFFPQGYKAEEESKQQPANVDSEESGGEEGEYGVAVGQAVSRSMGSLSRAPPTTSSSSRHVTAPRTQQLAHSASQASLGSISTATSVGGDSRKGSDSSIAPSTRPVGNSRSLSRPPAPKGIQSSTSTPNLSQSSLSGTLQQQQQSTPPATRAKRKPKRIDWVKGSLLGTGSFGNVYLGLNKQTGEFMAVKQVQLPDEEPLDAVGDSPASNRTAEKIRSRRKQMADAMQREITLLEELENPYIVRYLGSERDGKFFNIFLEYVPGGSVQSILGNYGVLDQDLIKIYVRQILMGLVYLHAKKIIHRDIKSGNILVDNKGCVKITDFGISKKVPSNGDQRNSAMTIHQQAGNRTSTLQGSVFWMAPEVVKDYKYSPKADIWSLGCLILEMLTNNHPWPELNQMQAMFRIGKFEAPPLPKEVEEGSDLADFLDRCFVLHYKDRADATELLQHPFLQEHTVTESQQGSMELDGSLLSLDTSLPNITNPTNTKMASPRSQRNNSNANANISAVSPATPLRRKQAQIPGGVSNGSSSSLREQRDRRRGREEEQHEEEEEEDVLTTDFFDLAIL